MKPSLLYYISQSPASLLLALCIFLTSLFALHNQKLFWNMVFHPTSVLKDGQYYRLVSSDLVHVNFTHLALNEAMIFAYCANLEQYLNRSTQHGSEKFIIIYIGSCLTGAIIMTIRHGKDFGYSSAGASGSIMGCLFSFVILQPKMVAFYLPGVGAVSNLYFGLICIITFILYQKRNQNPLLNHEAHFYGAIGGITITLLFFPGLI